MLHRQSVDEVLGVLALARVKFLQDRQRAWEISGGTDLALVAGMSQPAISVLVVDDDEGMPLMIQRILGRHGCDVRIAHTLGEGRARLREARADFLIADFLLPDGTGPELVRWALAEKLSRTAFCITAAANCNNVVEAMRAGCADVLEKPIDMRRITDLISAYRQNAEGDLGAWRMKYAPEVIGEDRALLQALRVVRRVAETESTVLITGPSGCGKEEIARSVHRASARHDHPFVALNCAAIPENLIEAELFGHSRGAFTGAANAREGRIAAAAGGTLFLDEIGDMPLAAQAKLLRVLQDRTMTPVGADRPVQINVRVVAATNKDLDAEVAAGRFRLDLLYRLNVINIELPSLSDRSGDIMAIANHLLKRVSKTPMTFDADVVEMLTSHAWPGNVRELANTIERAVVMSDGRTITMADLILGSKRKSGPMRIAQLSVVPAAPAMPPVPLPLPAADEGTSLKAALELVERRLISEALERTGGNRTEAAALLGLNRSTLVEKLRKFGS